MCGRLRLENVAAQAGPGEIKWVNPKGSTWIQIGEHKVQGIWDGHARSETLQKWLDGGWKECKIPAVAFTEGHGQLARDFQIPADKAICGICREVQIKGTGTMIFKIVTRDAATVEEKAVHPRFPKIA